jgi:hypothetical protein
LFDVKTPLMNVFLRCVLALAVTVGAAGCGGGASAYAGPPVLLEVLWQSGTTRTLVWSLDPDAAVAPVVPAAGTEIDFVFDRLLDGNRIESSDGGVPVPRPDPPIIVSWADAATAMSDPPFATTVLYNSVGIFGPRTAYVFVRPHVAGFPSATAVQFTLDPSGITGTSGEPMQGPTEITVMTQPFAIVSLPTGGQTVPTGFLAPVVFSTRVDAGARIAALTPFVRVTAAGAPIPFALVPDPGDRKLLYVAPGACDGKWPAGVAVAVTFEAGLPDAFGRPLGAAVTGGFTTSTTGAVTDGGCE